MEEVEVEEEVTVASSSRSGVSVSPAKRVESVAPTEILPEEVEDLQPRSRQKSAVRRSMPPPPEPPVTRRASRHAPETSFRPEVLKGKGRAFDPPAPEAEPSMMRRHTFVDAGRPLVSRRAGMWPRHSLPAAISRPPKRASSRRSSMVVDGIPLSEQDQRAMVKVGLDVTLQQKAAQSGFAPDVVRHAFRAVGKLDLLDRWLREMTNNVSTTAQRVALRLVKEEEALSRSGYCDDDEDGEEDEGSAGSSELEREPETSWSEEQSSVYYPPDNSRAADLLRAEAERQRLGEAGSSRGASGRREEPAPAPSRDPRMNFAQQILGKLRHR
ncbi:hypothetical protein PHLGIDRAFT_416085 [Phlebiopsis gigantea 11061_1 CR5-6]|uniref:Uncharacterized protein n=1 Tax=Phlebiopsis gigantea (strain 11061_1 CR5-6) TaxID=745531 RepID=A0A0C3SB05_PHLG1|nr:hypothetical protein PHLGIDRAFT_416085 [Phlebiopsis gigantea 11061_1 CR5-6]